MSSNNPMAFVKHYGTIELIVLAFAPLIVLIAIVTIGPLSIQLDPSMPLSHAVISGLLFGLGLASSVWAIVHTIKRLKQSKENRTE